MAVSPADLGLPDGRIVEVLTPEGNGWATVRSLSPGSRYPTDLTDLLHYDSDGWTFVPATLTDAPDDQLAWTIDLSVTPDGTVWVVEGLAADGGLSIAPDGNIWLATGDGKRTRRLYVITPAALLAPE